MSSKKHLLELLAQNETPVVLPDWFRELTPGRWSLLVSEQKGDSVNGSVLANPDGGDVLHMPVDGTRDQILANGQLFSASKDLLELALYAHQLLAPLSEHQPTLAALNKAIGETIEQARSGSRRFRRGVEAQDADEDEDE